MSLEENKAIIRRLSEAENERNLAILDELMAPDLLKDVTRLLNCEVQKVTNNS